jgi:hypothetical protein
MEYEDEMRYKKGLFAYAVGYSVKERNKQARKWDEMR